MFGVPSGKLLGFIVSSRGIEANPIKVNAIRYMKPPRSKKDLMKLTGCMAALSRFISRLNDRGLPFFKLLKKYNKFEWNEDPVHSSGAPLGLLFRLRSSARCQSSRLGSSPRPDGHSSLALLLVACTNGGSESRAEQGQWPALQRVMEPDGGPACRT